MSALPSLDRLALSIPAHFTASAFIALSIILLLRKLFDTHRRKHFEKLYGCEKAPDESDRFKYDILGIAKAIELGSHLRDQTVLSYTDSLFQRYGETYTSNIFIQPFVFTCNSKNIKHLLSTGFKDFDISALRKHLFDPITPHGIFTLDGPDWKTNREGLRGRLRNLRQLIDFDFLEEQFQIYLKHVPPHGEKFDVQACNFALFTDLQTYFSLGESSNSLSSTQTVAQRQFVDDLSTIKDCIVRDGFRGPLHHFSSKKEFFRACERAKDYVIERTTQQVRKRREYTIKVGTEDSFEGTESEEIAVSTDQALSILIANDTMGTTLSAVLFCLSHNEHVTTKLRASIIETIGMKPPTWTQLGSLVYVRWAICEAMRLFPVLVVNARIANKRSHLPTGGGKDGESPILIEKGVIVIYSTWARHRLGEEFGENLDKFYPERWETLSMNMPGYLPFSKGPRVCPGQQYSMIVLTYLVARIFQTFLTVTNYNTGPWKEKIGLTLENENGVLIGLS